MPDNGFGVEQSALASFLQNVRHGTFCKMSAMGHYGHIHPNHCCCSRLLIFVTTEENKTNQQTNFQIVSSQWKHEGIKDQVRCRAIPSLLALELGRRQVVCIRRSCVLKQSSDNYCNLKRGYSIIKSKVVKVRKPSPICEIKFVYKETHVIVVTPR